LLCGEGGGGVYCEENWKEGETVRRIGRRGEREGETVTGRIVTDDR